MKYLNSYNYFVEKRNLESREKVTVSNRIVNFLEKYNFKYEGYAKDSNIFVSFKTGDFETIIPSRKLGGDQYTSPQGFYCFDMNGFKQRLFGDESISAENFSPDNLSRASNSILSLGLGYGNHGNEVDSENIWNPFTGIPRYLYFVKVKEGSLILSSNSNSLKFYDPLRNLLEFYSHIFLKENKSNVFDPKDKRDSGLDKKSFKELKNYFSENKEKYNSNFIDSLLRLFKSIDKDEKDLHVTMYYFLMRCCKIISNDNAYLRFNLLCRSIGIDGFTQRKGENDFIHSSPEFQTLLLTESCVEDLMKIDLRRELKTDQYVSKEKSKKNLDDFLKSNEKGDILFNKKQYRFIRFDEDFIEKLKEPISEKLTINIEDYIKVNLNNNEIWNFIKNIKSGDWIKINRLLKEEGYGGKINDKIEESIIIQFNDIKKNNNIISFDTRGKIFNEYIVSDKYVNYRIGEESFNNIKYSYNLERKDKETPLFDPRLVNLQEYNYYLDNKLEFKSKGIKLEDMIDDYYYDEIVNNLEELFTNKNYQNDVNRVRIYDDMSLLTLLTNFKNKYVDRVYSSNRSGDFTKDKMKLYYYTNGDIDKPFMVIDSDNPKF
jgi:hypothetical protein